MKQIALIAFLTLSPVGYPRPPAQGPRISHLNANGGTCDAALAACLELTQAQDASIRNLKQANKELADRLASATKPPILPTWAIILLSGLAGATAASLLHK